MSDLHARSGAVLGAVLGLGLLFVWLGLPRRRRPGLGERVVPYLPDVPSLCPPSVRAASRGGVMSLVVTPLVADLARAVDTMMGGRASVGAGCSGPASRRTSSGSAPGRCCGERQEPHRGRVRDGDVPDPRRRSA